jgi:hypothetical protein
MEPTRDLFSPTPGARGPGTTDVPDSAPRGFGINVAAPTGIPQPTALSMAGAGPAIAHAVKEAMTEHILPAITHKLE